MKTEIIVVFVSLASFIISINTYRAFNLRKWKSAVLHFVVAIGIFSMFEIISLLDLFYNNLLAVAVELLVIGLLTRGIYNIKRTAEMLGS